MHEAVAAIAACGVSPIVRVAANESWMVKRSHVAASAQNVILIMSRGFRFWRCVRILRHCLAAEAHADPSPWYHRTSA